MLSSPWWHVSRSVLISRRRCANATSGRIVPMVAIAQQYVATLLAGSQQGRLYRQGLRTAIIGRPNVGSPACSTLCLRSERAIVTPIAGTTRDTVEEVANLRGIPLHLIDTAGITPSSDPVEQIGVQRSRAAAESADVVLLVFDGSEALTAQDRQVSSELQTMGFSSQRDDATTASPSLLLSGTHRPVIVVVNKADMPQHSGDGRGRAAWPEAPVVLTSTLTGTGLPELEEAVANLVLGRENAPYRERAGHECTSPGGFASCL